MSHRNNVLRIKAVHNALGQLKNDVVFVGGATVSLYADRVTEEVRPTDDVDVLIEIWTYKDYAVIDEQLRKMGFVNDQNSNVICRYTIQGITVDIMPMSNEVLGFSNKWYDEGFRNAITYELDEEQKIKVFSSPYFIATKLEAFTSPAREDNNNGLYSHDFEDIIFVLENRSSVWDEINEAPDNVKNYLKDHINRLLNNPRFEEWVDAHAGFGIPPATYFIIDNLKKFAA